MTNSVPIVDQVGDIAAIIRDRANGVDRDAPFPPQKYSYRSSTSPTPTLIGSIIDDMAGIRQAIHAQQTDPNHGVTPLQPGKTAPAMNLPIATDFQGLGVELRRQMITLPMTNTNRRLTDPPPSPVTAFASPSPLSAPPVIDILPRGVSRLDLRTVPLFFQWSNRSISDVVATPVCPTMIVYTGRFQGYLTFDDLVEVFGFNTGPFAAVVPELHYNGIGVHGPITGSFVYHRFDSKPA